MGAGNPDLVEYIRAAIRREGPVTFEWFMEQALYHPEFGYYSSGKCQIGREGDYFTNVSVGPLFGRIVAAQFADMWEKMERPGEFTIVEQGAHDGRFAGDVLNAARNEAPEFFEALRYCIVEPFRILRTRQEDLLGEFGERISWRGSLKELDRFCGIHFSNELLDSLPVRLIRLEANGEWTERRVSDSDEGFVVRATPIRDEKLRLRLEKIPRPLDPGYESEVNLVASAWLENLASKVERGYVLAVDYGYPRDQFYSPSRNTGTLQSYAKHRRGGSVLADVGESDVTAHVEWTTVVEEAEHAGLRLAGFTDQHHFITGLLSSVTIEEPDRRQLQTLLHPEFLGTRFHYLALSKDVPADSLKGFQFARDPRRVLGL
jgi:SAM-dependent MidA family methyltransferase